MRSAAALLAALILASCASKRELTPEYSAEIEKWRADRIERLKAEDGWLTLVGLYWIEEGVSTIGSDLHANVILPPTLPPKVGTIELRGTHAHFTPAPGVPLQATDLINDSQNDTTILQLGSVRFYLIEREGRYGVRIKNSQTRARLQFAGLEYFPTDPSWRVDAHLTPDPHQVTFATEAGPPQIYPSPGYLEFDRDGTHYKVDGVEEDGELFLVFRDATSGKTTYDAARFLYTYLPDAEGRVHIDFNRAYNPPCVFTAYATCPLPPPQNVLTTAVEAGEKKYKGLTATP